MKDFFERIKQAAEESGEQMSAEFFRRLDDENVDERVRPLLLGVAACGLETFHHPRAVIDAKKIIDAVYDETERVIAEAYDKVFALKLHEIGGYNIVADIKDVAEDAQLYGDYVELTAVNRDPMNLDATIDEMKCKIEKMIEPLATQCHSMLNELFSENNFVKKRPAFARLIIQRHSLDHVTVGYKVLI